MSRPLLVLHQTLCSKPPEHNKGAGVEGQGIVTNHELYKVNITVIISIVQPEHVLLYLTGITGRESLG